MATLTERYGMDVSLGGERHQSYQTKSSTLTAVLDQILIVPTSQVTVVTVAAAVAGGTLTDFEYLRVENLALGADDTTSANYVTIGIKETGSADECFFRIPAGRAFVLYSKQFSANGTGAGTDTSATIASITLQANSAAVKCRILAGDDATS